MESNELEAKNDEIARLEAQHSQGLAYTEALEAALNRIIELADPDKQNCLPECDSIAHEELCSWAHPEAVMAKIATEALG